MLNSYVEGIDFTVVLFCILGNYQGKIWYANFIYTVLETFAVILYNLFSSLFSCIQSGVSQARLPAADNALQHTDVSKSHFVRYRKSHFVRYLLNGIIGHIQAVTIHIFG